MLWLFNEVNTFEAIWKGNTNNKGAQIMNCSRNNNNIIV